MKTIWYKVESVSLNNSEPPHYPNPDTAPVMTIASSQAMYQPQLIHPAFIHMALDLIQRADKNNNPLTLNKQGKSPRYIHALIAQEMRIRGNTNPDLERESKRIVKALLDRVLIIEVETLIGGKNMRKCVRLTPEGEKILNQKQNGNDSAGSNHECST
jgi:hypothetical protein